MMRISAVFDSREHMLGFQSILIGSLFVPEVVMGSDLGYPDVQFAHLVWIFQFKLVSSIVVVTLSVVQLSQLLLLGRFYCGLHRKWLSSDGCDG